MSDPTQTPDEPRWQQPDFSTPGDASAPLTGRVIVPGERVSFPARQVPPPSTAEVIVGTLSGLVWPVMIALVVFTSLTLWPGILIAIVASAVLRRVHMQLRAQRRAQIAPPPTPPSAPPASDLR